MDDNRPLKGNSSGKYNMNFIDPTNDICAYYNGMTELQEIVEQYLDTITWHTIKEAKTQPSKIYDKNIKKQHYLDHCSVCLQKFTQGTNSIKKGQQVKVLPCRHCFHKDCVSPWFSTRNHCPNCRYELPI